MNTLTVGSKLIMTPVHGLTGEMVITAIEPVDPDLDIFREGDIIRVHETVVEAENGKRHEYDTYFFANKLIDGVVIYNQWTWTLVPTTKIELYENNAGGLLVGAGATWYDMTLVQDDSSFADDAAAFAAGETQDWTVDRYDGADVTARAELIAVWENGEIEIVSTPGSAARCYLHLAETIARQLTEADIAAWHAGELTEHAATLIQKYGDFQIWGRQTGSEPLTVKML